MRNASDNVWTDVHGRALLPFAPTYACLSADTCFSTCLHLCLCCPFKMQGVLSIHLNCRTRAHLSSYKAFLPALALIIFLSFSLCVRRSLYLTNSTCTSQSLESIICCISTRNEQNRRDREEGEA